jgi:beta-mannosidase
LPIAPRIDSSLAKSEGGYSLTLRSAALARNVYVSFADLDVEASDNYFDLLPGERVTITLKTSSALDQVKSALKVTSLTEAF